MATYVNDLRLTELATGEGSGTWGTTTNTNLELIGEALGYATQQAFGSDADTTTTVADGVSDPARAMYYKVTSAVSLTATRTLTIAPNTLSRVMFIENATTGSQSIAISQGSGANVTIATGKTAVVYLDGAGATAAVVDAMAGVDPGVTDTLAEVLVAGNTSGGTNIELSTTDKVQFRDTAIYINSSADGQLDIVADTEVQIATTTVDLNGILDVSGNTTLGADVTFTGASYNAVWDSSDSALEFADNAKAIFGAGSDLQIYHDATSNIIDSSAATLAIQAPQFVVQDDTGAKNIIWVTQPAASVFDVRLSYDGSTKLATTATGIDVTGTVTTGDIYVGAGSATSPSVQMNDTNSGLFAPAGNTIAFSTAGGERVRIDASGNVGIGTTSPSSYYATTLVVDAPDEDGITVVSPTTGRGYLAFADGTSGSSQYRGYFGYDHANDSLQIATAGAEAMRIDASGNVGIGTSTNLANGTLNVESNGTSVLQARSDTAGVNDGDTTVVVSRALNSTAGKWANAIYRGYSHAWSYGTNAATNEAMRIDSSGNVGIGTDSPNGNSQLHIAHAGAAQLRIEDTTSAGTCAINFSDALDGNVGQILYSHADNSLAIKTNDSERMRIDTSGNVGIGTDSPSSVLSVKSDINNNVNNGILFEAADSTNKLLQLYENSVGECYMGFYQADVQTALIRTNGASYFNGGSVGIGTTSPATTLHVENDASTSEIIRIGSSTVTHNTGLYMRTTGTAGISWGTGGALAFYGSGAGSAERMRIDSSGNLLVGKTSASGSTVGGEIRATGAVLAVCDGDFAGYFNRKTSDGEIVRFVKDTTTVGSIGVDNNDNFYIGATTSGHSGFYFGNTNVAPMAAGTKVDNTIDLGSSSTRFKDLYLSGGAYLGGTAAANKLDDYEEGTFSGTVDGTTYSGEYTKVGNLVTISCYYDCSAATNNRIAIVPFACSGVVSTQNSGAGITASSSATHPEGTSACVFGTTANVYAYSYARATLGTPSTGNGSFQFTYYTTE
jgi:hypothetical protein